MKVSSDQARIFITKEAAAQRQIDAAVRMTLNGEDALAIHTVAAAAYQILRDLKKKRGRKELADRIGLGIFAFAEDLASGKLKQLPPGISGSQILVKIISQVQAAIKSGDVKSEADVIRLLTVHGDKSHWRKFSLPANFLKHADHFPGDTLVLDDVDNDALLMSATTAYIELMGTATDEMLVYSIFLGVANEDLSSKVRAIAALPPGQRCRRCRSLLRDLKRRGTIALV